jgi:fatty-acyl-CoA synthase
MSLWLRLEDVVRASPDKIAVHASDATLTYADLLRAAEEAHVALANQGVISGDRVAFLGLNSAALLVLVFAAARGGFMVSPLNWRLAEDELSWIVEHADPKVIIADDHHTEIAKLIANELPVLDAARLGAGDDGWLNVQSQTAPPPSGGPEDRVLLVYTSGATGRPKGAILTQRAVQANADLSVDMHEMTPADHVLTALPMFHVGGLNIQTLPALLCGATVTLMDRFEPGACLRVLSETRATLTVQVPATFQALLGHHDWQSTDLEALRLIATGSTDVPVPLIERVHARGIPVIQIYGATETGPVVVYQKASEATSHIGSIGRTGPGVLVQITGVDGERLPDEQDGEIWIQSPTLASGYWRNSTADTAFKNGWFRTGDVARRDRIKNVIISGGENIYPAELERILRDIPGITEAAVTGRSDERWGAVPVAVVVGHASRDEILGAFQNRLARFKHPKDVVYVDTLPRNAMGKVEMMRLRELVANT